ncbi:MAG: FHA domain-containing protein, partial [Deltaproteobacteria bacterium]|nr:FHA domain-containing protein [Deltaproteobacteria bacterium]
MTFRIYDGENLVRTETLAQDIIKVGKLPSSHLRIEDENVSRMHAVIEVTSPDEVYIIDLGSAAGTIVNGKKVNKGKLQNGDEIVLGGTRIVVELAAAEAEDEPTTMGARPP